MVREEGEEIRVKVSPTVKNTRMRSSTFKSKLPDWKDLRIFFRLVFDVLRKSLEVDYVPYFQRRKVTRLDTFSARQMELDESN